MADDGIAHEVPVAPDLTHDKHLGMAHAHVVAVGEHASQAAAHLAAARDDSGSGPDSDGDGKSGEPNGNGHSGSPAARSMSAQERAFSFGQGTGAARSLRVLGVRVTGTARRSGSPTPWTRGSWHGSGASQRRRGHRTATATDPGT
jgi:hypothetical protein